MPKTAKTRPVKNSNLVILTPDELKTLVSLLDTWISSFISYSEDNRSDRRLIAKLEKIKGKLRRGF